MVGGGGGGGSEGRKKEKEIKRGRWVGAAWAS